MPLSTWTRVGLELGLPSFPLFDEAIQKTLDSVCNYHDFGPSITFRLGIGLHSSWDPRILLYMPVGDCFCLIANMG